MWTRVVHGVPVLLSLFPLHEQLNDEVPLLVDFQADVFGDVWDEPVHEVTHQHNHILKENYESEAGCQNGPEFS